MNYNLLQNCNITTEKFTNKQKINKNMKRNNEIKTTYQYSDYRGSEMIWSTEDIESIAEQLGINYLSFEDYDKILHDTFKNYGQEIMEEVRGFFEAQTWNHVKALQTEYNNKK
tara:strand:+ start:1340 stop:1678 length:339 start_codon:yes stop_codon:yes gene_type:complete